jgi:hypothetical protein
VVGDVVITREEIRGLMEGRLCVDAPPLGHTRLTDWIERRKDTLGRRNTSEMARRLDRVAEYLPSHCRRRVRDRSGARARSGFTAHGDAAPDDAQCMGPS